MSYQLIGDPPGLPVSVASAKAALNIDAAITVWDSTISDLIKAAAEHAEHETGRSLMPQTLMLSLTDWPDELIIKKAPVRTVTSVSYFDGASWQTLSGSAWVAWQDGLLTRIDPVVSWPGLGTTPGHRVRVTFEAGYASDALVPAAIKRWIIAQVGSWLRNVESTSTNLEMNPSLASLLDGERLYV